MLAKVREAKNDVSELLEEDSIQGKDRALLERLESDLDEAEDTLILGERDMMTPAKAGKALAAAIPHAKTVVVPGAGHMIMAERPDELLAALRS